MIVSEVASSTADAQSMQDTFKAYSDNWTRKRFDRDYRQLGMTAEKMNKSSDDNTFGRTYDISPTASISAQPSRQGLPVSEKNNQRSKRNQINSSTNNVVSSVVKRTPNIDMDLLRESYEKNKLKLFVLGAFTAVALNYLLTFIGTLPVVRRLVSKFIWRVERPGSVDDLRDGSKLGDASRVAELTSPPSIAQLEAEVESTDGEDVKWVNMCWRKAWRVYQRGLEQWISDLLQPVFDNLVAEGMVPKFVQRLRIAEFTLDHEAPYFSNMRRRNSRKDSDLNGVVDVRYTGGARMLLLIECGTGRWRIKVPVLVSDLDLECRMWIKVRLAPMCPWIGTLNLAFVGLPTIKVQLSPYNRVRLMSIPILQPFLTKLLTVDLPGLITLPNKLEIHIPPAVTAVAEAAVGRDAVMRAVASAVLQADALEHALISALPLGPQGAAGGISLPETFQGELQVTLIEARDLPVWGFPWQSNPYCRLALGAQAVRSRKDSETSLPSRHRAPVWNQEFQFLVEDPTVQELELVIRDSPMTGRTEVGHARFSLSSLPTDGNIDVWLPVESTMPGERQHGAIRISVGYKPFTDEDSDSNIKDDSTLRALLAIGEELEDETSAIIDVKSAADASSRANVAASAAATAIAVTKAAAARAAARLARGGKAQSDKLEGEKEKEKLEEETRSLDADMAVEDAVLSNVTGTRPKSQFESEKMAQNNELSYATVEIPSDTKENKFESPGTTLSDMTTELSKSKKVFSSLQYDDPNRQEAAVQELENMAKTMQQLTDEVQALNLQKGNDNVTNEAAETAAKTVAAAEALAVAAVVSGDVASANTALQNAAIALEGTAAIVKEKREADLEKEQILNNDGMQDKLNVDETQTTSIAENRNSPRLSPEERAAQALEAARQAAASAAEAVEALEQNSSKTPVSKQVLESGADQVWEQPNGNGTYTPTLSALSYKPTTSQNSELAADAIPGTDSQQLSFSSTDKSNRLYRDDHMDDKLVHSAEMESVAEVGKGSEWWNQALNMVPGVPTVHDIAKDTAADADGSAGIQLVPLVDSEYVSKESKGTSDKDHGTVDGKEQNDASKSWWSDIKRWFKKKEAIESDKTTSSEAGDESTLKELSAINQKIRKETRESDEAIGDIILSPDVPIEEIAAEVQKSWKLRDRHVEILVNKAMESRQRQKERPWLVLTGIMTTSSAILLSIVLYQMMHNR